MAAAVGGAGDAGENGGANGEMDAAAAAAAAAAAGGFIGVGSGIGVDGYLAIVFFEVGAGGELGEGGGCWYESRPGKKGG